MAQTRANSPITPVGWVYEKSGEARGRGATQSRR
jgi:hypothetical protein